MDFGRQRGFLLDGADPPKKVGCRKESYFLEFMYTYVSRDFVGVVFHVLLDGTKGSHNHRDCCCFEPPHSLNLIITCIIMVLIIVTLIVFVITFLSLKWRVLSGGIRHVIIIIIIIILV